MKKMFKLTKEEQHHASAMAMHEGFALASMFSAGEAVARPAIVVKAIRIFFISISKCWI
jgi:hypothetical protein